jgi:hypothetical protein
MNEVPVVLGIPLYQERLRELAIMSVILHLLKPELVESHCRPPAQTAVRRPCPKLE